MSYHYEQDPLFANEEYYEDEYDDYDEWYEDHYMGGGWDVHKAQNGQLYAVETLVWRGDFGDDSISSTQQTYSLRELSQSGRAACIRIGMKLKPGQSKEVTITDEDESGGWDEDYLCPACHCSKCECHVNDPNYIPF